MNSMPVGLSETVARMQALRDARDAAKAKRAKLFGTKTEEYPWEAGVAHALPKDSAEAQLAEEYEHALIEAEAAEARAEAEELRRKRQAGEFDMPPNNID